MPALGDRKVVKAVLSAALVCFSGLAGAGGHATLSSLRSDGIDTRIAVLETKVQDLGRQLNEMNAKLDRLIDRR